GDTRSELPVELDKALELALADGADNRLGHRLRSARMQRQMAESDDVAGECELDDLVASVLPTQVVAKCAALDAVQLVADVAGMEQRVAACEPAHTRGRPRRRALGADVRFADLG